MKAPVFPIFSLKTYKENVIVAGGGGSVFFGKKNGIIVLDETTYKDIAFYETEDIILELCISSSELSLEIDDYKKSYNNTSDYTIDEINNKDRDSKKKSYNNTSDYTIDEINNSKTKNTTTSIEGSMQQKNNNINPTQVYIACKGNYYIYILKFDGKDFSLIQKVKTTASSLIFEKHIIFISDKKVFAFYDPVKTSKSLDKLMKKEESKKKKGFLKDESHEEYIYALKKAGKKIEIQREEGATDVPENWENFFIVENRIHKITKENEKYCFVFNGKKYFFSEEIGDIFYSKNGTLVFYLKGIISTLTFINQIEIIHQINKITCINEVDDDFIVVGTGDGIAYLYKDGKLMCSEKLCYFPITGISYNKGYFYYSSFNGLVSRKKVTSFKRLILIVSVLLILLLAIFIKLFFPTLKYKN